MKTGGGVGQAGTRAGSRGAGLQGARSAGGDPALLPLVIEPRLPAGASGLGGPRSGGFGFKTWKFFLGSFVLSLGLANAFALAQNLQGWVHSFEGLVPLAVVVGVILTVRSLFRSPPLALRLLLLLGASGLNFRYLHWRLTETLLWDWYNGPVSVALVLMECLAIFNVMLVSYQALCPTNRSQEVDRIRGVLEDEAFTPTVDVFIPTYNESIDVLRRTLVGCSALNYPQKTIWLLDDGDRPEAAALAESLGCRYLAREDRSHAKAGNLNHGLHHSQGDLVVVFDADFIPLNHFLERTVPLFVDPQVALVVTPQNFYNPDPPEMNLGGQMLPHEQTVFYDIIQAGRDATNSVICTGTSTVMRRCHLEAIGGIPLDTIVEDWVTGFRLQAQGYRTLYLNEMLSVGAAPENMAAYLLQRLRWGEGTLRTLGSRHSPLVVPGLNWVQRLNHASGGLYWLDQALQSVAYVMPVLFALLGMQSMRLTIPELVSYWLPTYLAGLFLVSWTVGSRTLFVSYVYNALQCFHLLPMVLQVLLRPRSKIAFKVTPKGVKQGRSDLNLPLLWPVLLLFVCNLVVFVLGTLHLEGMRLQHELHVINTFWAGWNTMILGLTILASIDGIEERQSMQVPCAETWQLQREGDGSGFGFVGQVLNVSEGGFGMVCPEGVFGERSDDMSGDRSGGMRLRLGDRLRVRLPGEGLALEAEVVRTDRLIGCQFLGLTPELHHRLIDWIYCRPQRWSKPQVAHERLAILSIGRSLFGLYPLRRLR